MKELPTMLDLQKYHDEAIANHLQQQQELDDLLPIIEDAGALIVEKMALFNHYNRQARAEVRIADAILACVRDSEGSLSFMYPMMSTFNCSSRVEKLFFCIVG